MTRVAFHGYISPTSLELAEANWSQTGIIVPLSKSADFFGEKKTMDYVEPGAFDRYFYFMECERVIFHAKGKTLHQAAGSGETPLQRHVGVTVIRGRHLVVENQK